MLGKCFYSYKNANFLPSRNLFRVDFILQLPCFHNVSAWSSALFEVWLVWVGMLWLCVMRLSHGLDSTSFLESAQLLQLFMSECAGFK